MITPGVIATDNLSAINLVARGYDPDVTNGGISDEINVKAQTPKVTNTAVADKNSAVTIDSDFMVNGEVKGDLNANKVTVTTDLTVGRKATFNGDMVFANTDPKSVVTIPNLTVTKHLNIKGTVTGINSTSDTVSTDKIDAKTKGNR